MMKREYIKIYAVDIDKTLTNETCWTEEQCLNATPNQKMIDYVNNLFENHQTIILYTARKHSLYEATIRWIKKVGCNYSAIRMGKLAADHYIDDRSIHPDDI